MSENRVILTREGYEKLKADLDFMTSKKRVEIAKDLHKARAFGDLRENAEYESAKQAQALNERRIAELGGRLVRAEILEEDRIPKDKAFLGARVTLKELKTKEVLEYQLVSPEEADYKENKVSVTSPVGQALLGHRKGETVNIHAPAGEIKYKIIKITR